MEDLKQRTNPSLAELAYTGLTTLGCNGRRPHQARGVRVAVCRLAETAILIPSIDRGSEVRRPFQLRLASISAEKISIIGIGIRSAFPLAPPRAPRSLLGSLACPADAG
jgi:hypothetical protein